MQIKKDVAFDYEIALEDGVTTQYPQTKIYDQSDALVTTLDLAHITLGRYNANYTYAGTDKLLKAHTIIYSDAGHTSENTTYKRGHEDLEVFDYSVAGDQMDLVNAPNSIAIAAIKTGLGTVPASGNWSIAGDKMDLVDAPNATAISAIKTGLGTVPASGNWAIAGDQMNLADNAITSGKFDESTAYPLTQADSGNTALARVGADSDTLETLSDQLDGIHTKTTNLPASPAAVGSEMKLENDAITSAKFDESTAFPVKSADTGSTAIARTGADSDTLETLSDQIDTINIDTDALETDVKRILGLVQENFYLDNPTFDSDNNLLTARVRTYSLAASVGTTSNVLATYTMTATFSAAGKVTTYKLVKV